MLVISQVACSPQLVTPGPLPSPVIWQVAVTPALAWLGPIFQRCASSQPGVNLVISQKPASQIDPAIVDLAFRWGGIAQPPAFAAEIGQDELAVVVNPTNPVNSLSSSQLIQLFNGSLTRWSQLDLKNFDGMVTAYRYALSEDVQQAADWLPVGPAGILAPDPAAVRQAVAAETYSVGYLPARWVDTSVKRVAIAGLGTDQQTRPILALAQSEPQGARRALLLCVQDQLNR